MSCSRLYLLVIILKKNQEYDFEFFKFPPLPALYLDEPGYQGVMEGEYFNAFLQFIKQMWEVGPSQQHDQFC